MGGPLTFPVLGVHTHLRSVGRLTNRETTRFAFMLMLRRHKKHARTPPGGVPTEGPSQMPRLDRRLQACSFLRFAPVCLTGEKLKF